MAEILVVDDDEKIRKTLKRILEKEKYVVAFAEDGEIALKKVAEDIPDVVLLDLMMPKMDGSRVCKYLKENPKYSSIYVIMLTAKDSTEDEIEGLDLGADDYMAKPFRPELLLARIRKGFKLSKEKFQATFDPLTKLYNRSTFELYLKQEVARIRRYHHSLSLIMLDIDHFKKINDTYGHEAGDLVLKEFANILRQEGRETDLPVRWGGEEMMLLLPETDIEGAKGKAEQIRQKVENHEFSQVGKVTASFGVSYIKDIGTEMEGTSLDRISLSSSLVKSADKALYEAKEGGRNRVVSAGN